LVFERSSYINHVGTVPMGQRGTGFLLLLQLFGHALAEFRNTEIICVPVLMS
jgi:hypothetical protein